MQLFYASILFALITANWAYVVQNERLSGAPNEKSPTDLYRALFKDYAKNVRPVKKYTDVITTHIGIQPLFIRELDEEKEILVMDSWVAMMWDDAFLTWNMEQYGGIKSINVPSEEVWKPDITLYTGSPDVKITLQTFTNVIVNHTGLIMWVPPLTISSRCPLDLEHFPYDTQVCHIKFGSWTFGKSASDIQLYPPFQDMGIFQDTNPNWSLTGISVERVDNYYPCCPNESYPSINMNVTLKRKQSAPMELAQSVSYYAGFLALLMFWFPPDSVYKIVIGAIAEALMGISVLYLGTVLPTPLTSLKAAARIYPMMCAVSGALIVEILVMNFARFMGPCRPPRCLLAIAKAFCAPLCVCSSGWKSNSDSITELTHPDKLEKYDLSAREEWNFVAMALDRILFVFALAFSIFFYKFC